ncbi:MAG: PadR family transcriptional regulator [Chloroflexota bacterium]|nr:PadR family transcriptional regulator [Chloroflexota bacterium]
MSTGELTPTSYLVLGLLTREGPSTPYDLKRYAAAAMGRFWSFPHALLYAEPARLVRMGLATEAKEESGRRRRTFTITGAGTDALCTWLEAPSRESPELRDPGLLQLFFADLGSAGVEGVIAREQLSIHRAKLASFERDSRTAGRTSAPGGDQRTKKWHSRTLRMGIVYERAAVDFWQDVGAGIAVEEAAVA